MASYIEESTSELEVHITPSHKSEREIAFIIKVANNETDTTD